MKEKIKEDKVRMKCKGEDKWKVVLKRKILRDLNEKGGKEGKG